MAPRSASPTSPRSRDSVENINTLGLFNGEPAVIVLVTLQPGANVIQTVDSVRALLPELQDQLPKDIKLQVATDRTHSIRASLHEVEITLLIAVAAGRARRQRLPAQRPRDHHPGRRHRRCRCWALSRSCTCWVSR